MSPAALFILQRSASQHLLCVLRWPGQELLAEVAGALTAVPPARLPLLAGPWKPAFVPSLCDNRTRRSASGCRPAGRCRPGCRCPAVIAGERPGGGAHSHQGFGKGPPLSWSPGHTLLSLPLSEGKQDGEFGPDCGVRVCGCGSPRRQHHVSLGTTSPPQSSGLTVTLGGSPYAFLPLWVVVCRTRHVTRKSVASQGLLSVACRWLWVYSDLLEGEFKVRLVVFLRTMFRSEFLPFG